MKEQVKEVIKLNKCYGNNLSEEKELTKGVISKVKWQFEEAIGECQEALDAIDNYELGEISHDDLKEELIDAFTDNQVFAMLIPALLGLNSEVHFDETMKANFSKLCKTEEEAVETKQFYVNQGVMCRIEKVDDMFVVVSSLEQVSDSGKFFSANKVLKNIRWNSPNHKQYF